MPPIIFHLLLLFSTFVSVLAKSANPISSSISVVGVVYCDSCFTNSFSKNNYFLPGVDVQIQCKFQANSPKTTEQINFSVNRTTDKYGIYKLEIPHVDGVDCVDGSEIESLCEARLIKSSSSSNCNVPGLKITTEEVSVKSKQDNHCIYSLNALSYRPKKKNITLCGTYQKEDLKTSLNSSKFFLPPYFPPYGFPFPPTIPKFPFPFPPIPNFPFPFPQSPPSLPFPFPPLPNFPFPFAPPPPSFPFPFPPIPKFPFPFAPPPPPSFPFPFPPLPPFPYFFQPPPPPLPPPPPAFNLGDPRTWIPHFPPSPPQNQKP